MQAGEICRRDVVTTLAETPVVEVSRLMRKLHVGSVVLIEEHDAIKKPVGIITDRDLVLEVLTLEVNPQKLLAADLVRGDLIFCSYRDDIWQCMRVMQSHGIRRLPIVDHRLSLIGIITLDDIIDVLVTQLGELSRTISSEQNREKFSRQDIKNY